MYWDIEFLKSLKNRLKINVPIPWCPKMRVRVKKVDMLAWTLSSSETQTYRVIGDRLSTTVLARMAACCPASQRSRRHVIPRRISYALCTPGVIHKTHGVLCVPGLLSDPAEFLHNPLNKYLAETLLGGTVPRS